MSDFEPSMLLERDELDRLREAERRLAAAAVGTRRPAASVDPVELSLPEWLLSRVGERSAAWRT